MLKPPALLSSLIVSVAGSLGALGGITSQNPVAPTTQPVLPKGNSGPRRGLELPDAPKTKPTSKTPKEAPRTEQPSSRPENNNATPVANPLEEKNAISDPFANVVPVSGEDRAAAIFRALLHAREPKDPLLQHAVDELLKEGELALHSIEIALKSNSGPCVTVAARTLRQLNKPEFATVVFETLRRGVPNESANAVFDTLVAVDADLTQHLFELVEHRSASVRSRSAALLEGRVQPADEARIRTLAASRRSESRQLAAQLTASFDSAASTRILLALLSDSTPTVALTAAESLARSRATNVRQELLENALRSAQDRTFGYFCIALCLREELRGEMIPSDLTNQCLEATANPSPFVASAAAAALATIGFRSEDIKSTSYLESRVVPILVMAAAGERFFADFNSIHSLALRRLALLTDRDFGSNGPAWAQWWREQRESFRANRAGLLLPDGEIDALALDVETPDLKFTIRGEQSEAGAQSIDDEDYIVTAQELSSVASAIRSAKLLDVSTLPGVRGAVKSNAAATTPKDNALAASSTIKICVRHKGQRKEIGISGQEQWPELVSVTEQCALLRTANLWQRYKTGDGTNDRKEVVVREREVLAAETNVEARNGRLMVSILEAIPKFTNSRRASAYKDLLKIPGLQNRLSEERTLQLAQYVAVDQPGSLEAQDLLRLLASVPTPKVFDTSMDQAAGLARPQARLQIPLVLAAFPIEHSVRALDDPRTLVRACAVESVGKRGAVAAAAVLFDRLSDSAEEVQIASIRVLVERKERAAIPLIQSLAKSARGPLLKEAITALGKLRAVECFETIWSGISSPEVATRIASLNAIGDLGDARGAEFLCLYWTRLLADHSSPAEERLAARSALLTIRSEKTQESLRRALDTNDDDVRREVVLALAESGDPAAVPALISQLDRAVDGKIRNALVTLTCVDLFEGGEPMLRYREWWEANRSVSPAKWFTSACGRAGVGLDLSTAVLESADAKKAIPALNEVLVDARDWYLRIRAGEILNSIVGEKLAMIDRYTPLDERRRVAGVFLKIYEKR